MSKPIYQTYHGETTVIHQYQYPAALYQSEVYSHAAQVDEYMEEISEAMQEILVEARPNLRLLANQPYLTPASRLRLVDFGLKMSVRLKVLPFVFCRAVRLFDRYCSKRIMLADQGQLVMATCLWIASKVHGENCHFANMHHDRRDPKARTISDLGYGCGGRLNGPTQRFRQPRVVELIRLCGSRCQYTPRMFNQMELYIMSSLDWNLTEPGVDDYLISSDELNVTHHHADSRHRPEAYEFWRMKQFVAYAACFSYEMVGYDAIQLAKATVDLINQTFRLSIHDHRFQAPNPCINTSDSCPDYAAYNTLRRSLVEAVVRAPVFLLDFFGDKGPQYLFYLLTEAGSSVSLKMPRALPPSNSSPTITATTTANTSSSSSSDSPATPRDYTYEHVTEVARSVKRIDQGDLMYPRVWRRNLAGLLTPTISAANVHSHQYPTLHSQHSLHSHQQSVPYVKPNDSQASVPSSNSSKESDIFEHERHRFGVLTPVTDDSDCKDRKSSFVDASVSAIRKFL